ncbi:MAG: biotin--[acetyl-CoA-carboxylase] ligase [Chloroflexi bacterium]|nr:MAG: biotin--[acetyl-CoA-carboxylase] ligase [Chloroflexota bacterium]
MATDRLAAAVDALAPPWEGHYYAALESTQDEARAAARVGAPDRSIYVSDYQRSGRGRQGRTWLAAPGTALLLSILFRDTDVAPRPWRWTSLASVALVEATDELLVTKKAAIKWPNDVMLDDRKVAGILAENTWDGRQLLAIVGVGVNINTPPADLAALPSPATSLAIACGQDVDRGELLKALIRRMNHWLEQPVPELFKSWQSRLWGRGQRLRLLDLGEEHEVIVLGAAPDGSLRIRLPDGAERTTTTGELIL